jgi:hypothetical protein
MGAIKIFAGLFGGQLKSGMLPEQDGFKEMNLTHKFVPVCLILMSLLIAGTSRADDERLLICESGQTTFFAEREYILKWEKGRDFWENADSLALRLSSSNKIILQQNIPAKAPVIFKLNCPELRPGIVLDATITISAYSQQQLQQRVYSQNVRIYSKEQPLLTQGIGPSDLGVIDKTPDKRLVSMLKHFGLPYTPVERITDLPHKWMFCAGLDFNNSLLFDGLYALTGKDHSVLVLYSVKGKFLLPPFAEKGRITLADHYIIRDMDKHLNLLTTGQAAIQDESFQFKMIGGKPGVEIVNTAEGFGWVELRKDQGKMIFCGYNLYNIYEDNPSVGMMIADLLKDIVNNK